jgi:hypothetical protein
MLAALAIEHGVTLHSARHGASIEGEIGGGIGRVEKTTVLDD